VKGSQEMVGHMTSKIRNNSKGFTIVELLIVIVVIGILAALVIVQFTNVQARARDAERKSDIRALQSKVAEYYALNGYYPTALSQISNLPADACKAPGGSGTCASPDYTYKAFKTGTAVATTSTTDCDNTTNNCVSYIIYTPGSGVGAMETIANPYSVTSN
jgi:prepilin-type N-terminal cleavage/methylation domain-containing protein